MGSKTSTTATALSNEEKEKLAREKFKKAHKATFDGDSISAEGIRELRAKGPEPIIVDVRTGNPAFVDSFILNLIMHKTIFEQRG